MKFSDARYFRTSFFVFVLLFVGANGVLTSHAQAGKKEKYDIIYLLTKDIDRVLDYKAELETIFDEKIVQKLKVVGRGDEYALIYDGNDSAATVSRTLINHAELLNKAGFDEPYATKEQNFHGLYNVSYGMGPNIEPLKMKYEQIYGCLGMDVKNDLFIEKTVYGNFALIYRRRGDKASTTEIARKHAAILRAKKIKTSITTENNNQVVYGESSLINDVGPSKPIVCTLPVSDAKKKVPEKIVATPKIVKTPAATEPIVASAKFSKCEKSIEEYIDTLRKEGRISKDESTGWMVYDLEKNQSVVNINADQEFQAASMIKPFVALAFFHQVNAGKLKYGPGSRKKLEAMIQRSSNSATNWVMRQAGGPAKCDAILKKYYGKIFKKTEIREYIPAGGRTYLNSAPPSDYVRFLRALWNMDLPQGKEIRRLMALPGRDRLYHGTPIPKGTLVYNKTGSTAHLIGDMGILVPKTAKGGQFPYVIVGIIERRSKAPNYGQWAHSRSRVIREVSTLVYEEMKKEHHLL